MQVNYTELSTMDTLSVRVMERLKKDFLQTCHLQDRTGSQVIRQLMRDFIIKSARDYEDKCNEEKKDES